MLCTPSLGCGLRGSPSLPRGALAVSAVTSWAQDSGVPPTQLLCALRPPEWQRSIWVWAPSPTHWLRGTRALVPRPHYIYMYLSRAAPRHWLVFRAHLAPSGHTFPCWAGSLLGLLPRPVPRSLSSIHHSLEASCPECDSPGGSEALSRAGKAAEGPLSYIFTATSRQRTHFTGRQWPSGDGSAPGPGGVGEKAQGRGPRAGPAGCRELSGRPSWRGAEDLQSIPPHTLVCCQDLWRPTHPAEEQGQLAPGLLAP